MRHHFVLVHGGLHGAWCWWKVKDRLQKAGWKVTAVDLVGDGQHHADPNTIFSFQEYNKPTLLQVFKNFQSKQIKCLNFEEGAENPPTSQYFPTPTLKRSSTQSTDVSKPINQSRRSLTMSVSENAFQTSLKV